MFDATGDTRGKKRYLVDENGDFLTFRSTPARELPILDVVSDSSAPGHEPDQIGLFSVEKAGLPLPGSAEAENMQRAEAMIAAKAYAKMMAERPENIAKLSSRQMARYFCCRQGIPGPSLKIAILSSRIPGLKEGLDAAFDLEAGGVDFNQDMAATDLKSGHLAEEVI